MPTAKGTREKEEMIYDWGRSSFEQAKDRTMLPINRCLDTLQQFALFQHKLQNDFSREGGEVLLSPLHAYR